MRKLTVVAVAFGLAVTLAGCEKVMHTPAGRQEAFERCMESGNTWVETPQAWECVK